MDKPIREYRPTLSRQIILLSLALAVMIYIFYQLAFSPQATPTERYRHLVNQIVIVPYCLVFLYQLFYILISYKRSPVIRIFRNKVELHQKNSQLMLTGKDVDSISMRTNFEQYIFGIKLKRPEKIAERDFSKRKPDLLYSVLHYMLFRLNRIPVSFSQFKSHAKKDVTHVITSIYSLNERANGAHLVFYGLYYPDMRHLLQDLYTVLGLNPKARPAQKYSRLSVFSFAYSAILLAVYFFMYISVGFRYHSLEVLAMSAFGVIGVIIGIYSYLEITMNYSLKGLFLSYACQFMNIFMLCNTIYWRFMGYF